MIFRTETIENGLRFFLFFGGSCNCKKRQRNGWGNGIQVEDSCNRTIISTKFHLQKKVWWFKTKFCGKKEEEEVGRKKMMKQIKGGVLQSMVPPLAFYMGKQYTNFHFITRWCYCKEFHFALFCYALIPCSLLLNTNITSFFNLSISH